MRTSWREVELDDVATELTVGHVGPMVTEYRDRGVPFIRSTDIEPFRINRSELKFINPEFHAKLKKSALRPGDVVIVRTGKPGTAAVIPDELPDANCSDVVIVRTAPDLDPRYLVYYVNSAGRAHVSAHSGGAVQQHFNVGAARRIRMNLPPIEEQREIVDVLGALDDKIELNRRMNATLEAMAHAVFKEWFVDGAKEDWDETTVGDEFAIVMGQSPPGDTYNEAGEGVPFFQGRTDFGFRFPTPRVYCTAPTRLAKQGDTLVSVRAPVGSVNMAEHDCAIGRGVAAIRHKTGARSFTYHLMHSLKPQFELFEAGGTVFGSMNKKDFHGIKIQQPSPDRIHAFEKLVGTFDDRVTNNEAETRTLTALRDTLLPKLMRGEVMVKDNKLMTNA